MLGFVHHPDRRVVLVQIGQGVDILRPDDLDLVDKAQGFQQVLALIQRELRRRPGLRLDGFICPQVNLHLAQAGGLVQKAHLAGAQIVKGSNNDYISHTMFLRCLGQAHLGMQRAGHGLFGDDQQITAAATRVHRPGVALLIDFHQTYQIHRQAGVAHRMRQQGLPAAHTFVHRCAQARPHRTAGWQRSSLYRSAPGGGPTPVPGF